METKRNLYVYRNCGELYVSEYDRGNTIIEVEEGQPFYVADQYEEDSPMAQEVYTERPTTEDLKKMTVNYDVENDTEEDTTVTVHLSECKAVAPGDRSPYIESNIIEEVSTVHKYNADTDYYEPVE